MAKSSKKKRFASPLDRYDRRIVDELRVDGRLPVAELARRIGLSKTPTQMRLRRLVADGYIRSFRAVVDPMKLGAGHIAYAEVKLSDTREKALAEFRKAALREIE